MLLAFDSGTVDLAAGGWIGDDGRRVPLGPRERDLLQYLATRDGVVERDELLTAVFGYRPGARTRVVDDTVKRLRAKIEVDPRAPRHLLSTRGAGYRLVVGRSAPRTLGPGWSLDPGTGTLRHPGGQLALSPAEADTLGRIAAAGGSVVPR
ncbi:MAG: helix-turn-helix domain-containing protein, partial [Myxococcota bacterium]